MLRFVVLFSLLAVSQQSPLLGNLLNLNLDALLNLDLSPVLALLGKINLDVDLLSSVTNPADLLKRLEQINSQADAALENCLANLYDVQLLGDPSALTAALNDYLDLNKNVAEVKKLYQSLSTAN
ncbi:uncharacterized protein LOC125499943 [Athalia rosae]|uniref:uncharacterized protein LOC125499943 n=1 Tax=Athalia rosae TaxID=37344 RepID=UPI00203358CB|nr:uncharacterized protein LOC125499943 [Athalia rosae]